MAHAKNTVVRARINSRVKQDVEHVLACLGLTVSDAINILFYQIMLKKGLPFDLKVPNELTQKTLSLSARGKEVKRFDNLGELYKDLGINES